MKESVAAVTRSHDGDRNVNLIMGVLMLQVGKSWAWSSFRLTRCFQVRSVSGVNSRKKTVITSKDTTSSQCENTCTSKQGLPYLRTRGRSSTGIHMMMWIWTKVVTTWYC